MSPAGFLEMLLSLSLQVAVLIGVCGWLVRKTSDRDAGHRLWGACHAMILFVTLAAIGLPHLRLIPHSLVTDRLPIGIVASSQQWLGEAIFTAWALGAALYAVAIVIGMLDVRRILANAEPMHQPDYSHDGEVTILVSSRVKSPFCWQMHHPVLVLPEAARGFRPDELSAIIRHELAHLRAGHPVALFLQRLVEMLYWFHPIVWWASRQAELNREFHCDHVSNRDAHETANYLRSLLRLCEMTPESEFGLSARLSFQGNPSLIRLRIDRLMQVDRTQTDDSNHIAPQLLCLTGAAVLATCLWLPVNVQASSRSYWSPWPTWSTAALYELGIPARDYELDGHRLASHELNEANEKDH